MKVIGYLAALFALIAYLPQTIKTIRTKHTKDLSLPTFLIICGAAILWTIYGFGIGKPAIWLTNIVIALCTFTIVILKLQGS
ncbi:MAG TPA: SemiSWEET family transporter [Candidatus Saccharimonadales bacterium]|nr:SemiSWEET family transporter [Candidatus Saccharimonadales bacterium]